MVPGFPITARTADNISHISIERERARLTVLHTKTLLLAPCMPTDRADFMALERDPLVMRYLNGGYAVDQDIADPDATFLMPRGTEPFVWTARRQEGQAFVGWFCLWPDGDRVAELGYRLRRLDWGQGLASEGAFALVNWGFCSGSYEKIFATTMAVNHASRRVMEKTGFTYARTVYPQWPDPIPGSEDGEVVFEVTREQWRSL